MTLMFLWLKVSNRPARIVPVNSNPYKIYKRNIYWRIRGMYSGGNKKECPMFVYSKLF